MVHSTRSRRRRSLRPADVRSLVEGAVTHADTNDYVTVEIAGGPPRTTATVLVAGTVGDRVRLDGCGTGRVHLPAATTGLAIEIAVEDRVLLTGRLPAPVATERSGS